jgi:tetratricopeptide (TPR) repeat protein
LLNQDLDPSNGLDAPTLKPETPNLLDAKTMAFGTASAAPGPSDSSTGALRQFGDYEILTEIARGGMGVVYKARQVSLNRIVALKMILAGQLASPDDVKRFYVEAEAAAHLDHPGIVPIYEIGEHTGQHFFSMGFVEGGSLHNLLHSGPMNPREAVDMMIKVCEAIDYAHQRGVIHRDLKPANILLSTNVSGSRSSVSWERGQEALRSTSNLKQASNSTSKDFAPKVTDFGLAKQLGSQSDLTGTGQILGTPSYMPPEQADGRSTDIGPKSDVYSLGAILYCMLTGRPPFQAANPMETVMQVLSNEPISVRQLAPSAPKDLDTICLKCLQKDPNKRYGSAQELGADLIRWFHNEPILARPISLVERSQRWLLRHPAAASIAGIVIAAIASIVGILFYSNASLKRERDIAKTEHELAQSRLQSAVDAVDKMMTRVASERWALNPVLEHERQQVLQDAVEFYNGLISNSSSDPMVRHEAAKAHMRVSGAQFLLNRLDESADASNKARALLEELVAEFPKNFEYRAELSEAFSLLSSSHIVGGQNGSALHELERANTEIAAALQAEPDNTTFGIQYVQAHAHYAYFCISAYRAKGKKVLKPMVEQARSLVAKEEQTMEPRLLLAFALCVSGSYELTESHYSAALPIFDEAVQLVESIQGMSAPSASRADQYLQVRAIAFTNRALAEAATDDSPEALKRARDYVDQGIEQLETMMRVHPKAFVFKLMYMQALRTNANILRKQKNIDEATKVGEKLMQVQANLIEENPSLEWVKALANVQQSIDLVTRIRDGKAVDIDAEAETILTTAHPSEVNDLKYNLACAYSIASELSEDKKEQYVRSAIQLIRELHKRDYFDEFRTQHAKSDQDLKAVSTHPDFLKLFENKK